MATVDSWKPALFDYLCFITSVCQADSIASNRGGGNFVWISFVNRKFWKFAMQRNRISFDKRINSLSINSSPCNTITRIKRIKIYKDKRICYAFYEYRLYSQFLHSFETFIGELTKLSFRVAIILNFQSDLRFRKRSGSISRERRFLFKKTEFLSVPFNRVDPRWQKLLNVRECFQRGCSPDEREDGKRGGEGGGRWARACIIIWPVWIFISTALTRSACKKLQAFLSTLTPLSRFTYTAFINRVLRRESASIICHPVRLFQPSTTTAPSFIREINNVTRNIVE